MVLLENVLSSLPIAFAVLIVGYFLGRIRICGVSLDLAGVLIVAVLVGDLLVSGGVVGNTLNISEFKEDMQMLSSLGTALFVSVIGITTGYSLDFRKTNERKAILIGALMVASAFAVMQLIALHDTDVSYSKLLGALCGALTTTPGLSAANELKHVVAEEATVGYGCSYLFGVIATVLFVQVITRKSEAVGRETTQTAVTSEAALGGLIQIGFAVLLGRLIGGIRLGTFSFGNSGGILCAGIALGVSVKAFFPQRVASPKTVMTYRNLGLSLFFVGNGIPAGMSFRNGFDVKIVLYGMLMTVIPIITGTLLSRPAEQENGTAAIVAGGMTSTPAIGVLLEKHCSVALSNYSMAYVGALITVIALVRVS